MFARTLNACARLPTRRIWRGRVAWMLGLCMVAVLFPVGTAFASPSDQTKGTPKSLQLAELSAHLLFHEVWKGGRSKGLGIDDVILLLKRVTFHPCSGNEIAFKGVKIILPDGVFLQRKLRTQHLRLCSLFLNALQHTATLVHEIKEPIRQTNSSGDARFGIGRNFRQTAHATLNYLTDGQENLGPVYNGASGEQQGFPLLERRQMDANERDLNIIDGMVRRYILDQPEASGRIGTERIFTAGGSSPYQVLFPLIACELASLNHIHKREMIARWIFPEYDHGLPWAWVLGGVLAGLLALSLISWSNLRLRRTSRALKETKAALDRQLEFQQAFIEMVSCPVYMKDAQCRYLAVNEAYERQVHCSRQDLVGKTILETDHLSGDREQARQLHERDVALISSLGAEKRELQFVDLETGALRSAIVWVRAVTLATGPALVGTIVEITDIRIAEQKLAAFTRAIPATVFEFEVSPDAGRRFTFMEGRALQPFGLHNEDIVADPLVLFERCNRDDRGKLAEFISRASELLMAVPPTDFRIADADGWRWLRTEGGPPRRLPDGGATWTGYLVDVTELHEKNEALALARMQAEAATVAKSSFLATISHEVRTPMSDIIAILELLSVSTLDDDQKTMLGTAKDSAHALLHILGDVLDYSRIESGRLTVDPVPYSVRDLLDGLMELISPRASGRGLRLRLVTGWRVDNLLRGDAHRIRQILFNLLDNAIKFTEEGSISVVVDVERRLKDKVMIRFRVRDTGIGIAEQDLATLFQPFTQAERSTTRRFGGTGLGLSISQRLAEAMGGRVWLESKEGEGTSAYLELEQGVEPIAALPCIGEGKEVILDCVDQDNYDAAYNGLAWLGFNVVAGASDADVHSLIVTDRTVPEGGAAIVLAESVMDTHSEPGIQLVCSCPLLQRSLADACRVALGIGKENLEASSINSTARPCAGVRVLVAEDHAPNRLVIARQLDRLGCNFEIVGDGFQALAALEHSAFDLLITDCHMPGMDGYDLARAARQPGPGKRLVVFGISASTGAEQLQLCKEAGMDDFMPKPLDLKLLASKIVEHLDPLVGRRDASGAPAARLRGQEYLRDAFGDDEAALVEFLVNLRDSCRADLCAFAALDPSNIKAQRGLLHRLEGALDLVDPAGLETPPPGGSLDARLLVVKQRMAFLDLLVDQIRTQAMPDLSGEAGSL